MAGNNPVIALKSVVLPAPLLGVQDCDALARRDRKGRVVNRLERAEMDADAFELQQWFHQLGFLDALKIAGIGRLFHVLLWVIGPELQKTEVFGRSARSSIFRPGVLHLHYIYDGDVSRLSRIYSEGIEIKVFVGQSSLRRKLSKCNNLPIATLSSGLPLPMQNPG